MNGPIVSFKQIVPLGRALTRAPRDALGTIPTRGARYCEALTTACAYGWHVYPLTGFAVQFDGVDIFWTYDGAPMGAWWVLDACQYPDFAAEFDAAAPADVKGYSPPWLVRGQSTGVLQIWTGLIARTAPNWSLHLRAPANIPQSPGYFVLDGIIETDRWCGGLFCNIKLIKTDSEICFTPDRPYLQIQAVHRRYYSDYFLDNAASFDSGLDHLTDDDWRAYHQTVVKPSVDTDRTPGGYAVAVRKRRAQE